MTTWHLNLLPPDKKKKFVNLVHFIFIKELLEFVILTTTFLTIIHLLGLLVLSQTLTDLASSSLVVSREYNHVELEVRHINTVVRAITLSGQSHTQFTPKLLEFIAAVPRSITIQALNIDRTTNSLTVVGVATTREDLLDYQKILKSLSWANTVAAPISQLFQKENISFEIHGTLKNFAPLKTNAPVAVAGQESND